MLSGIELHRMSDELASISRLQLLDILALTAKKRGYLGISINYELDTYLGGPNVQDITPGINGYVATNAYERISKEWPVYAEDPATQGVTEGQYKAENVILWAQGILERTDNIEIQELASQIIRDVSADL